MPKVWTPELDEKLEAIWTTHRTVDVAEALGMTYEAVKARAKRLGLPNRHGTGRLPSRKTPVMRGLAPLEWAPGQFATDARSFEIIKRSLRA